TFAANHAFATGDRVIYSGTATGLTDGGTYYVRVVDAKTIKLFTSLTDANNTSTYNGVTITGTGSTGQSLRMDLDNSTATGTEHKLVTPSYYILSSNTVTRVLISDVADDGFKQGFITTPVSTDTAITLQNISAFGSVTITAGTTQFAES